MTALAYVLEQNSAMTLDDLQCARADGGAFGEREAAKPPRLSPDIDVR